MDKVVTFGEIMLKLTPDGFLRFRQAGRLNVEYSGAEANVAVSLANFGIETTFVSRVPANDFGEAACGALREMGVDTELMVRGGERLGIYFAEKGAAQRASRVIYDRKGSAIATAAESDFDWKRIFTGVRWFHFSGITPALSPTVAGICLDACRTAKEMGVTVSCDLNYRSKLWQKEEARKTMTELAQYVDICIANESDIADVYGITADECDVEAGQINQASYDVVAQKLLKKFSFRCVAITLRESLSASVNNWGAMLCTGTECLHSKRYTMNIVDRIGSGDAFAAGLIYGFISGYEPQKSLDFAVAASCLKHSIEGDFNRVGVAEVEALMDNHYSGRIQR